MGSDFADLFEVKDALGEEGSYTAGSRRKQLVLGYERETFGRETTISATAPAELAENGLTFAVTVEPHGEWTTELEVVRRRCCR